ncbi:MAG TPA: hypothetical protein PLU97_03460, partial [Candidatus Cryptobacteroides sp.]|nr:hypothetical protein [Candidatus Cryptobacteroides sp.]
MNEFSIGNIGKFGARLNDLESMVGGGATSSPDCQISNVEKMRGGYEIDLASFSFGYSINGAWVTVNAGTIRHGTRPPVNVWSRDILIAADKTWIYVRYNFGSFGGTPAFIESSMSEPVDTEDVHNHALYLVTLSEGVA